MNTTKQKVEVMIYKLRESLGKNDFLKCNVTGASWNNDKHNNFVNDLLTLRRLILKHHRIAEMSCNGEGSIRGTFYSWDNSRFAKSPAISDDLNVFDVESDKVETKIKAITERLGLRCEFQGDPRGYTVKVFYGDRFLDIQG